MSYRTPRLLREVSSIMGGYDPDGKALEELIDARHRDQSDARLKTYDSRSM